MRNNHQQSISNNHQKTLIINGVLTLPVFSLINNMLMAFKIVKFYQYYNYVAITVKQFYNNVLYILK